MRDCSIAEAKDSLPRLVHAVEAGESVRLMRYGKPVAVVLSIAEFERLSNSKSEATAWAGIERLRERLFVSGADFDGVLDGVRDPSPGRDFSW